MPRWTPIVIAFALVAAACGTGSADSAGDLEADPQPLECEVEGYPCSLEDVAQEVLERSDTLADGALDMLESGASGDDVHAWLEDQEGMVEVDSDEQAIRFRMDGGRGTWIFRTAAFATRGSPGSAVATPQLGGPIGTPTLHVAGPESKDKRARVLSPFLFQFGELDEGPLVSAMLSGTRGYEGRVEFAANESTTASNVNIDSYKGWNDLEVVHVATHGSTLCKKNKQPPCKTVVVASTLQGAAPQGEGVIVKKGKLFVRPDRGLDLGKAERPRELVPDVEEPEPEAPDPDAPRAERVEFVLLTSDFFSDQYPDGLDDTFVFINSCEMFRVDSDVANALRGRKGVFLGWDDTVSSLAAFSVADALYRDLSEKGHPVAVAYEDLRSRGLDVDPFLVEHAELILAPRRDLDGLHIRDVVELLDPVSGELMSSQTTVAVIGSQGDGEPDEVPYLIQVDGIKPEFAADVTVHFSVGGEEVDPQPLNDGTVDDDDRWLIGGVAPLGFDIEESTPMGFSAWVELDTGGESEDEMTATVIGDEPIMGFEWILESRSVVQLDTGGALEAEARLTLEFEEGQAFDESHPRYIVTGGEVTHFGHNASALGCDYSGVDQRFDVTPEMSPANPEPPTAPSVLVFDTTKSPVEYHGVIWTGGPDRVATQTCHYEGESITHDINYGGFVSWMIVSESRPGTVEGRISIVDSIEHAVGHTLAIAITRVR